MNFRIELRDRELRRKLSDLVTGEAWNPVTDVTKRCVAGHDNLWAARHNGAMKEDWASKYRFDERDLQRMQEGERAFFVVIAALGLATLGLAAWGLVWFVTSIWFLPAILLIAIYMVFMLVVSVILSILC
ncbi:MAG: hypothetical protein OXI17_06520 [Gammaproteobacteria bacterium]|nr:hypothetical protein [Gammaproteobacteria bacterium]MDE0478224.1 hypothetical protein [Gammaproteobacteria bacterium]MDE0508276.1 hypothetical protein [Gammaproteobacteria bacterium]